MKHIAMQTNMALGSTYAPARRLRISNVSGKKQKKSSRGHVPMPRNRRAINLDMLTEDTKTWLFNRLSMSDITKG